MSDDSFKIKKSLTLTPARMVDIINPQAGDLACDIDDNNKIKRYNDQKLLWEEIGSGGQDSSQLLDNGGFEEVERSWTLTAGVSSINPDPVVGDYCLEVSLAGEALELFQDSTINHTALSDGVQGLAYIRAKTALSGIKVCFRQAGVTSTNLCVDVNNNNKWGLYKLPVILGGTSNGIAVISDGVKTGTVLVDDAFVGAQDVKQDVSACNSIECETEFSAFVGTTNVISLQPRGFISSCSGTTDKTCNFVSGVFTSTPVCTVTSLSPTASTQGASRRLHSHPMTVSNTSIRLIGIDNADTAFNNVAVFINCRRTGTDFTNAKLLAGGSIYSTASDSFSTDTNTLTHKPSVAITAADPIGTFNTYSYAANSNTKTICTAAPSTLPTKANGFRIFTRAFNAASTCGNPARVEIKIAQAGTSLPTVKTDVYKSAGKIISGRTDLAINTATVTSGLSYRDYNESTGILSLDAGKSLNATDNTRVLDFSDGVTESSGYLVINAQKMKDAIVGDFKNTDKTPNVSNARTCSVNFGGATDPSNCTTGTCIKYSDNCGVFTSTFSTTGVYNITVADGACAGSSRVVDLGCSAMDIAGVVGKSCLVNPGSTLGFRMNANGGASWVAVVTNPAGTVSNATVNVYFKCEGN